MRIHLAGIIFKVSRISRVRSEDEHCHHGAAALTRNEFALDHFLGFRRARRQIDRKRLTKHIAWPDLFLGLLFKKIRENPETLESTITLYRVEDRHSQIKNLRSIELNKQTNYNYAISSSSVD